ncbi:hypothetical protein [Streptomyces alboniger]|uniref:LPXTG cell wall anchor domain-containing protein n=1 Tax=Streptomyces alboniger TaxID=132473 RepID=A0A5J6HKZ6_STRAD|nr:hypothetical protein [Streptomyces alboniger]QEV19174.1 hypothetical protein CP975_18220 [Streptomyces alboniger]
MRATRRTFRTAAIATGAIAALAVPATAAFAADAPSPSSSPSQDRTTSDARDRTDSEAPAPGSWESKGTTDLGHGWSAKVDVNVSARTAKAALSLNGTAKGSLTAYEKAASTTVDGNTFTLTPDGTLSMSAKPAPPKPKPEPKPDAKRVYRTTVKLADGSLAKIYKLGPHHYQADVFAHGSKLDTLDANGKAAYGQNNGLHVVLNPDGTVRSWVEGKNHHNGTKPQPAKPRPANGSHQVVPKGGVKAGAEGVTPESATDAPLVAAGGGMAALGAGGLGFALYRRRQNG